jgi:hypothetical protein
MNSNFNGIHNEIPKIYKLLKLNYLKSYIKNANNDANNDANIDANKLEKIDYTKPKTVILEIYNYNTDENKITICNLFENHKIETVVIHNEYGLSALLTLNNAVKELHIKCMIDNKIEMFHNLPNGIKILSLSFYNMAYSDNKNILSNNVINIVDFFPETLEIYILENYNYKELILPYNIKYVKVNYANCIKKISNIMNSLEYLEISEGYEGPDIRNELKKLPNLRYAFIRGKKNIIVVGKMIQNIQLQSKLYYNLYNYKQNYYEKIIDGKKIKNNKKKINSKNASNVLF